MSFLASVARRIRARIVSVHVTARTWPRGPAVPILIIVELGVALGMTVGSFEVASALVLRQASPYPAAERLFVLPGARNFKAYELLSREALPLDLAGRMHTRLPFGDSERAQGLAAECVTASYFAVLGVVPTNGRTFRNEDDLAGAYPVVVLSERLAVRVGGVRVGEDTLDLAGRRRQIIGIMPDAFSGLDGSRADVWLPLSAAANECSFTGRSLLALDEGGWFETVGRLHGSIAPTAAEAAVKQVSNAVLLGRGSTTRPELESLLQWRTEENVVRDIVTIAISVAAGAILLLSCFNAALLFTLRGLARTKEAGVRTCLGATPSRLLTGLASEGLRLTIGAAVLAMPVAVLMLRAVTAYFDLSVAGVLSVPHLVAVAALGTLLTGVAAFVLPAFGVWRLWLKTGLRPSPALARSRWQLSLVFAQVCLGVALVHGTFVFNRSVYQLTHQVGYDTQNVVIATADLARAGIPRAAERKSIFEEIAKNVESLDLVQGVALTTAAPFGSGQFDTVLAASSPDMPQMLSSFVAPSYFDVVGTPLLEGRTFTNGPAMNEAIVDKRLAGMLWPGEDVVNKCKRIASGPCVTIVGLSTPRRFQSPLRWVGEVFRPFHGGIVASPQALMIRTKGPAEQAVSSITRAIRASSPAAGVFEVRPMRFLLAGETKALQTGATLIGVFAAIAFALAVVGVYVVLATMVSSRRRDTAIRIAIGATPSRIVRAVAGSMFIVMMIAWGIGAAGSSVITGLARAAIPGLLPASNSTIALSLGALMLTGLFGALGPVWRAAHSNVVSELR